MSGLSVFAGNFNGAAIRVAATYLVEALGAEDIENNNKQGGIQCQEATRNAANKVKRVFE